MPRGSHAYSGTLRYWHGLPPFHPSEWSLDELRQFTSIDVIQLAGATLRVRIVRSDAEGQPAAIATPRSPEIEEIVELELLTPRSRFPKYVLRADTPDEARAWAASIAQHIWPLQ